MLRCVCLSHFSLPLPCSTPFLTNTNTHTYTYTHTVTTKGIAAKEVSSGALDKSWREVLSGMQEQGVLAPEAAEGLAATEFSVDYARQPLQVWVLFL